MDKQIDRRDVLAGLVAAGSLAAFPAKAGDSAVTFLVVGDWGRDGASHQADVAARMDAMAGARNARFVVSVGDNFYETGVKSTVDPQWKTSFENIYTGKNLQVPWYVALGNHDYRGNPQAQVDYSALSPRWKMPSRSFKVAGADFGAPAVDLFFIDTSPLVHEYAAKPGLLGENVKSQDTAAQLQWLDAQLTASTATSKIVIGHHTLFSGGSGHGNTPEMVERILPVLKAHKVLAYINGHDHDLQHIVRDGLNVVCTGAGSETRPVKAVEGTRFCAAQSGFSVITLTGSTVRLEFINVPGQTIYASELTPQTV